MMFFTFLACVFYDHDPYDPYKPLIRFPKHYEYEEENDLPEEPTISQIQDIMSEVKSGKADESRLKKIMEWIKGVIAKGEGKLDSLQRLLLNRLYSIILGFLLVTHLEENSQADFSELIALTGKSPSEISEEKKKSFQDIIDWIKEEIEKGEELWKEIKVEFIVQLIQMLIDWLLSGF